MMNVNSNFEKLSIRWINTNIFLNQNYVLRNNDHLFNILHVSLTTTACL